MQVTSSTRYKCDICNSTTTTTQIDQFARKSRHYSESYTRDLFRTDSAKHVLQCGVVVGSETRNSTYVCRNLIDEHCYIRLNMSVMIIATERPHSQFDRAIFATPGPSVDNILLIYVYNIDIVRVGPIPGLMAS